MAYTRAVRQLLSRRSRWLLTASAACFVFLQIPAPVRAETDLGALKTAFQMHVQEDEEEIARSESLLARSRAAHEQAVADNDADGSSITAQAISAAEQALARAQQNLTDDDLRLDLIDRYLTELDPKTIPADRTVPAAPRRSKADMDLLVDSILSSDKQSAWPGPKNPDLPLVNPLTAPHEASLDAGTKLLLGMADEGIADSRTAELRESTLREIADAVGDRYAADPEFRKQLDGQLDAAIAGLAKERERAAAAAEDRRFAKLRGAMDELEKRGLLQKGKPLAEQENENPALHAAMESVRAETRTEEESELEVISDQTTMELKAKVQKLAADNRLSAEVWEQHAKDQR